MEQAAEKFRRALLRQEREAATRLVRAYGKAYSKLQGDIQALVKALGEMDAPTRGQVERLSLYKALLRQIRDEVNRYAAVAEGEIGKGAESALTTALANSERLVQAALPKLGAARLRGLWVGLDPEAVATMAGFLQEDSPLYVNLRALGDEVAKVVAEKLLEGVVLGNNPRKVARIIRDATGQGLTWSLNTARTANIWAYRLAAHASYRANSHVVTEWVWWAQLGDPRTCLSCINMHGSVHGLDEVLNDHHAGRCTPLPKTVSYRDLGLEVPEEPQVYQRGETWFRLLTPEQQQAMMGAARWTAWRAGEFSFSDLSAPYRDDVYGVMLREASLKGLLGERAKRYYRRK